MPTTRLRGPHWVLVLFALTLSAMAVPPRIARGAPPAADPFVDRVDVRLIEVEVVVTDRRGQRVRDLRREDFRLTVGGRPVPVRLFEEVDLDPSRRSAEPERAAPHRPRVASVGRRGRSVLLFVDDSFTDRRGRALALKHLEQELDLLGPEDEVAVVRYEGGLLDVLTDWTSDPVAVGTALRSLRRTAAGELSTRARVRGQPDELVGLQVTAHQIEKMVAAAAVTMAGLADAKGRKLFIPISAGWPYDRFSVLDTHVIPLSEKQGGDRLDGSYGPRAEFDAAVEGLENGRALGDGGNPYLGGRENALRGGKANPTLDADLTPLFAAANRLGYTVYPIHVGIPCHLGGVEGEAGVSCTEGYETRRGALRLAAVETGGRILAEGGLSPTPLATAFEDTRAYYVLAFDGSDQEPGTEREIRVTIDRPGLKVRHRRSVLTLTPEGRASLVADRALLLGEGNGDLEFAVGEEQPRRQAVRLPVTLTIPMDWATTLPVAEGGVAAQLELRVAALDERGDRSETQVIPLDVAGPAPPKPGSRATYDLEVDIRPNTRRLVLVLHDKLTGESLSGSYERGRAPKT